MCTGGQSHLEKQNYQPEVCLNNLEIRFWLYRWSTKKSQGSLADDPISCKCIILFDTEFPATEISHNIPCAKHSKKMEFLFNTNPYSSHLQEKEKTKQNKTNPKPPPKTKIQTPRNYPRYLGALIHVSIQGLCKVDNWHRTT